MPSGPVYKTIEDENAPILGTLHLGNFNLVGNARRILEEQAALRAKFAAAINAQAANNKKGNKNKNNGNNNNNNINAGVCGIRGLAKYLKDAMGCGTRKRKQRGGSRRTRRRRATRRT